MKTWWRFAIPTVAWASSSRSARIAAPDTASARLAASQAEGDVQAIKRTEAQKDWGPIPGQVVAGRPVHFVRDDVDESRDHSEDDAFAEAQARLARQCGRVLEARWRVFSIRLAATPAGLLELAPASATAVLTIQATNSHFTLPAKGLLGGMDEVPSSAWREGAFAAESALADAPVPARWPTSCSATCSSGRSSRCPGSSSS